MVPSSEQLTRIYTSVPLDWWRLKNLTLLIVLVWSLISSIFEHLRQSQTMILQSLLAVTKYRLHLLMSRSVMTS
jgi:hypothetical protein